MRVGSSQCSQKARGKQASKLLYDGRGFREGHKTLLGLVVEWGTVAFGVERREKCMLTEKLRDKHSSFLYQVSAGKLGKRPQTQERKRERGVWRCMRIYYVFERCYMGIVKCSIQWACFRHAEPPHCYTHIPAWSDSMFSSNALDGGVTCIVRFWGPWG